MANPFFRPFTDRGFTHGELPPPDELMRGHPTNVGYRDPLTAGELARQGRDSPGNGRPGVPRVRSGKHHGPGIPGPTPSGPAQPGVSYEGEPRT